MRADDRITTDEGTNKVIQTLLEVYERVYQISLVTFQDQNAPDGPLGQTELRQFKRDYFTAIEYLKKRLRETNGDYTTQELERELPGNMFIPWARERLIDEVIDDHTLEIQSKVIKKRSNKPN